MWTNSYRAARGETTVAQGTAAEVAAEVCAIEVLGAVVTIFAVTAGGEIRVDEVAITTGDAPVAPTAAAPSAPLVPQTEAEIAQLQFRYAVGDIAKRARQARDRRVGREVIEDWRED